MKTYVKPMVLANEELAEGVYTASGSECYDVSAKITQRPQTGRNTYVIQVDSKHQADDNHTTNSQTLTIMFNMPVTYVTSRGTLYSGDGTAELSISYSYWNNATDNIGLGDVEVTAGEGLVVLGAKVTCNH